MEEKIEHLEYYKQKEREHVELLELWWYAIKIIVIIAGLLSIAENVHKFWTSYTSCF